MKPKSSVFWKSALAGLTMLLGAAPGYATLKLDPGLVGGSGDVDNVVFNPCSAPIVGPATTVQGCLNNSHSTLVNFTSNENLVADGGQASIGAQDGAFDTVTIALDDSTKGFAKLQFNLKVEGSSDGTADFVAIDQFGNSFTFDDVALGASGENKFTLYSLDDQVAVSFKLVSTVGLQLIDELDQVRLGPTDRCIENCTTATTATQIPEPSTFFLLGSGLLALAGGRLKKRR